MDFGPMTDAGFRTFGRAAIYTPAGGDPVAVTIILDAPVETVGLGATGARIPGYRAKLRKSEIAAPKRGDQVTSGGLTFKLQAAPTLDAEGLAWALDLEKQ